MTVDLTTVDFCDPRTYDNPWETFRALRAHESLWHDAKNNLFIAGRHEDIFHVSRDPETYCSRFGVRPVIAGDMSIITLDGEEHIRQRRLINAGFTPRRVRDLIPRVRDLSNMVIDQFIERGQIEFVEDFAMHVPLIIIAELMGLDPEQRKQMYYWSDAMMAGDGHTGGPVLDNAAQAFGEFATMCLELIPQRREDPADDLISVLVKAYDEGGLAKEKAISGVTEEQLAENRARMQHDPSLSDDELLGFLTVLLVAGNETTRNGISGGVWALSRFPEQKQYLLDNLDVDDAMDKAIDEIVRYVSPVLGFIRTVTRDHRYRNTDLKEGDRVLMLYGSANRDESVFDRPDELDLTRDPNPHLGFGIGPHFCLGANLARMELKTVFQELYSRIPDIQIPPDAPLKRADSTLVLALEELPASFTPGGCPVPH